MKTKLLELFAWNSKSIDAKNYLYSEFPEHFVWDEKKEESKHAIKVSQLNAPLESERYYL